MSRTETKEETVSNLKEKINKAGLAVVTDYRGLTVAEITDLRKRLSKNNAEYKIAKNTLIRIALKDTSLIELEKLLEGPTALLLSYGEPSECAKTLVEFIKEVEKGDIRGGILDGKLLNKQEIRTFATLPSREVLLGQIAGLLVANTAGIAGVFENLIRDIALLAEEVAKKKGSSGEG
ncbi:MAG: 50S ribosomal protein L10 [Candidatus Melainabacteria bacterium]|nr:50S ribosomal protein L10 [Candidatus Melainabacteria bacterium]